MNIFYFFNCYQLVTITSIIIVIIISIQWCAALSIKIRKYNIIIFIHNSELFFRFREIIEMYSL